MLNMSRMICVMLAVVCLTACNLDDDDDMQTGLSVTLVLKDKFGNPENTFVQGDPVSLELSITNNNQEPETLTSGCSLTIDFTVSEIDGPELWRLSHNLGCFAIVTNLTLAPGETNTEKFDWDQTADYGLGSIPPGGYVVAGWYVGRDEQVAARIMRIQ
jgi:hypothetical protein